MRSKPNLYWLVAGGLSYFDYLSAVNPVPAFDKNVRVGIKSRVMSESESGVEAVVGDQEGDKTDQAVLESRVRAWLRDTGKRAELQARLRAELFGLVQGEGGPALLGKEGRGGGRASTATPRTRAIAWLVRQ